MTLLHAIFAYWKSGGPVMIPLAGISVAMVYTFLRALRVLRSLGAQTTSAEFAIAYSALRESHRALRVLVGAAPLVGLFGTITGMILTFHGVSRGADNITPEIAAGIGQALITTQVGLSIAIPGLFASAYLRAKIRNYTA